MNYLDIFKKAAKRHNIKVEYSYDIKGKINSLPLEEDLRLGILQEVTKLSIGFSFSITDD